MKFLLLLITYFCAILLCVPFSTANAQIADSSLQVPQIDIFDFSREILGLPVNKKTTSKNITNNNVSISILPSFNYALATGFTVGGIVNTTLGGTTDTPTSKISTIRTIATYTQFKQYFAYIQPTIWSKDGQWNFSGDWRFYQFPTYTYGLGTNTNFDNSERIDYSHARFYQVVFRKISPQFFIGLGYHLDEHWNIIDENIDNNLFSAFRTYGYMNKSISSGLSFNILHDSRSNPNTPVKGAYLNVKYTNHQPFIGSDQVWTSLVIDARKYFPLSEKKYQILGFWLYQWLTLSGNPPYLDLPSTGWDTYGNMGRGYATGRFRSKNLISFETEYRVGLTKNGLLAGVLFSNVQTYSEPTNNYFQKAVMGVGIGLRAKINKPSNTYMAIDYAVGAGGSGGFFFNLGEVF
jgi:Omp85 superfamily domain